MRQVIRHQVPSVPAPIEPMRKVQLRRRVLMVLKAVFPHAYPEGGLWEEVNAQLRPPAEAHEKADTMEHLLTGRYIAVLPDDLGDDQERYHITERGRTVLAAS